MEFKQTEIISASYVMYTFAVMIFLLFLVYVALRYYKSRIVNSQFSKFKQVDIPKKIRLSSKTVVYIIDHNQQDIVVVESTAHVSVAKVHKREIQDL